MKYTYSKANGQIFFYAICAFFVVFNILTLSWHPLPGDEMTLHDFSVNFVENGAWYSTSGFADKNNEVYSTYPPLNQIILIPWIWLFGSSLTACRSLNVILVFFICTIIFRLLRNADVLKNYYSILVFLLLFWCADVFSWIFRNGRPDVLNMLCATGFLAAYYEKYNKWLLALFASLVFMSGIQACPFLLGVLVCLYFFQSDKKRVWTAICMFVVGTLGGLAILSFVSYLQGHFLSFYYRNFIVFSSTAQSIVSFLVPYLENLLKLDPAIHEALMKTNQTGSIPFFEKIADAYLVNKGYLLLSVVNGVLLAWLLFKKQITFENTELKLLAISLLLPAFMTLAGRFAIYYTWMSYIPAVICLVYTLGKHSHQLCVILAAGVATLVVVGFGLPKTLATTDRAAYERMESFILKQGFSKHDKIIAPFSAYYIIRNITKTCYFTGLYPLNLVPDDTKYILSAKNDFGDENMYIYINRRILDGKHVAVVDSLDSPQMTLFVVE
jgi:hypothetical protein